METRTKEKRVRLTTKRDFVGEGKISRKGRVHEL